jgi:hypothetical protein
MLSGAAAAGGSDEVNAAEDSAPEDDEATEDSEEGGTESLGVSFVVPEGFEPGFKDSKNGASIHEFVLSGETVHNWTQIITVTRKEGGINVSLQSYFAGFKQRIVKGCPGADVRLVVDKSKSEFPFVGIMMDCPPASGRPQGEIALIQAMNGEDDFFTVQKAWHYKKPSPKLQTEMKAFIDILNTVRPCNGDDSLPGCEA